MEERYARLFGAQTEPGPAPGGVLSLAQNIPRHRDANHVIKEDESQHWPEENHTVFVNICKYTIHGAHGLVICERDSFHQRIARAYIVHHPAIWMIRRFFTGLATMSLGTDPKFAHEEMLYFKGGKRMC